MTARSPRRAPRFLLLLGITPGVVLLLLFACGVLSVGVPAPEAVRIPPLPILILLSLISAGAACQDAAPASPFSGAFCRILGLRPGEKSYIIER